MATEGKKTPDDKIRDKFDDKIKKIDSNKDQAYTDEEIQDFLENDKNSKKVCQLGELMNEHFETQTESLEQFKEIIGRICERILASVEQGKAIDLNKGRILYFYLKHFHRENTGVGRDIIKSVVDGSKGNRYESVARDLQNNNEEWFNNLPGVTEIKADLKREQDSKKCNEILESQNRLSSEDIQWLNEYKSNGSLNAELLNKVNERLDLEKCYQLLASINLTFNDIEWLEIQNSNGKFDPELLNKINEKLESEVSKLCTQIIESTDILSKENIQWLKKYREKLSENSQELISRIDEALELEETSEDITRSVDAEMSSDPLSNLEIISPGFGKIKPNWKLIVQRITPENVKKVETESDVNKLAEKIKTTITKENISQFITIPKGVSEEDLDYITCNFQNILIKHLCLHPGYKIFWGKDPNAYATGMSLDNIVTENQLLESAFKKLEERKNGNGKTKFDQLKPKQKEEQLKRVFGENNHILFDLRLKNVLNSCDNKKIGEIISYIINYSNQKYPGKLNDFAKSNTFINSVVQEYNAAKQKAEEEKKRAEEENKKQDEVNKLLIGSNINLPISIRDIFAYGDIHNEGRTYPTNVSIISRRDIAKYEKDGTLTKMRNGRKTSSAYDYFCRVYEASQNFYKSDFVTKNPLGLPNSLDARDYIDFLAEYRKMTDNIDEISKEYKKKTAEITDNSSPYVDCMVYGPHYASAKSLASSKKGIIMLQTARKFVELWKKSGGSYKPDNFCGVFKLDWSCGPKTDDIIRDSVWEGIVDKVKSFWRNATGGCFQQAFGDIIGLGTGLVLSSVTLTYTGNPALAGASYYLGSKLGNGLAQVGWDLVVDGLGGKVLGLVGESGANRFDGIDASAGLGIGSCKRDENGNVIQAKTQGEWLIDTAFGTVATAATFQFASNLGITITENPFKYASIDEFINKPLSNVGAAATKAYLGTQSYEGISAGDAVSSQFSEEYGVQGITKKCINVFLITAMVKGYRATYNWSKNHSDIIGRIDQKLDKITSFLKSKGTSIEKLSEIPGGELKKMMKEGLSGLVDDLAKESQKGWNSIIVPMVPLAISGLISPMLSPTGILSRRRDRVKEKIRSAKTQEEKARYEKLLTRYDNIEKYINENILAPTPDNGNLNGDAGAGNETSQSQTQIDQQIENDFKIGEDGIIDVEPPEYMSAPQNYRV